MQQPAPTEDNGGRSLVKRLSCSPGGAQSLSCRNQQWSPLVANEALKCAPVAVWRIRSP